MNDSNRSASSGRARHPNVRPRAYNRPRAEVVLATSALSSVNDVELRTPRLAHDFDSRARRRNRSPAVTLSRRAVVGAGLGLAGAWLLPAARVRAADPSFAMSPFTLGVASGYPEPNAIVLWT